MALASAPAKATKFERDPLDFYIEARWTILALLAVEQFRGVVLDPCAGSGTIPDAVKKFVAHQRAIDSARQGLATITHVEASDIVKREPQPGWPGWYGEASDFLDRTGEVDNVIANPPFMQCTAATRFRFIRKALAVTRYKVALLLPSSYVNGEKRQRFLSETPLYRVYFLSPRPHMAPGAGYAPGTKAGINGRIDFAWFIWLNGFTGPWTGHVLNRSAAANVLRSTRTELAPQP